MSSIFKSPKRPKIPEPEPEPEEIEVVEEGAAEAARREKKKILRGGRRGTIISGIMSALKRRLGE